MQQQPYYALIHPWRVLHTVLGHDRSRTTKHRQWRWSPYHSSIYGVYIQHQQKHSAVTTLLHHGSTSGASAVADVPRGACHVGGDGRWTGGRETRLMTIHERESGRSMHAWPCMPMLDEPDPDRRER